MDVLTAERMRKVDEETIKRFCPGLELMERAGRQVAEFILRRFPEDGFKASIFVGPGNNGGDALVVARYLAEAGRRCSLHYLTDPKKLATDALKNYQRIHKLLPDVPGLKEINSTRPDWDSLVRKDFLDTTLIVDGLFGTGLARDLTDRAAEIVRLINRSSRPVISIDTPSGIHSDTGEILGEAVKADYTITMGYPKLGMLFYPGKSHVGELRVANLGFPEEVLQVNSLGIYLLDRYAAAQRLPARAPDVHKYEAGSVLVVAGSRRYTGAALLAAEGALRSGCGIVYIAVPEGVREIVQNGLHEGIVVPLPETAAGGIAAEGPAQLLAHLDRADAVILGPGLGDEEATARFVTAMVDGVDVPLVVDADALNLLAGHKERLAARPAPTVVTPHSGELKRLMELTTLPTDPIGRINLARDAASALDVTLLHKGAPTVIAASDGEAWVNHSGNSALASAGTGDVLSGLVAGFIAQGASGLDAAVLACFLHGRAGERAAAVLGIRGVIAGDVLRYLGSAMLEIETLADNGPRPARSG
jgi:NAD(P)H-hydrate epimerase